MCEVQQYSKDATSSSKFMMPCDNFLYSAEEKETEIATMYQDYLLGALFAMESMPDECLM